MSVEVFWRFNLNPRVKDVFVTPEDYRRWIESDPEPSTILESDLGDQVIVPAANSWLVPSERIHRMSAAELKVQINFDQPPPYIVMVFSVERMIGAGVQVRPPTGIDAIPSRLTHWYRENVPDERIDRDIPRAALERVEWRP